MRKTIKTMLVLGAAATFFAGSLSFAADHTRTGTQQQSRNRSCLSIQSSQNQTRQMSQQRLNQGTGTQSRAQKQSRRGK
ncbi:MAG: hypothetical protein AB2L11_00305 [Syntrophobacteraceae bacterium]